MRSLLCSTLQTETEAEQIRRQESEAHGKLESPGAVLQEAEATAYKALAARANYLALDRPDVAYATQ